MSLHRFGESVFRPLVILLVNVMNKSTKILFPSYGIKVNYAMPSFSSALVAQKKEGDLQNEEKKSDVGAAGSAPVGESESDPLKWLEAGNSAVQKGMHAQAIDFYTRAIELKPDYLHAVYNRAGAYLALNKLPESLVDYQQAEEIDPLLVLAKYNAGVVLSKLGRRDEAIVYFKKALEINELHLESLYNLGCIYLDGKEYIDAIRCFDQAIGINPGVAEFHNNRASALQKIGDKSEALKGYQAALKINPTYASALSNYGVLLADFNRPSDAISALKNAIRMGLNSVITWHVLGMCQNEYGDKKEALISLKKAVDIDPDHDALLSDYLHVKMKACDWSEIGDLRTVLRDGVKNRGLIANPFSVATSIDDLILQRKVAEGYVSKIYGFHQELTNKFSIPDSGPIKIGYYSADFQEHATMYLMIEMLEAHSHDEFEWFVFNFGPQQEDGMRQRVRDAVDHFIDVRDFSDVQIAEKSRELGIDIAVDLKGYTGNTRFGAFVHRCAPVQVSYLGYPGTTGAKCMDYIIADAVVAPEGYSQGYSESIVRLPDCYQPNNSQRKISSRAFIRAEMGLPEDCFVYCSFNANYKITPEIFDCWMNILRGNQSSVLWVYVDNDVAADNLVKEAVSRGVKSNRIIFAETMSNEDHLARYKLADLFLDTYPCNAHTTASDALWAGVPVLTLAGESFASRVAASLLTSLGLTELITRSAHEYVQKAIAIGVNSSEISALKERLNQNKKNAKLFDGKDRAKQLEKAFRIMHERRIGGIAPSAISLE